WRRCGGWCRRCAYCFFLPNSRRWRRARRGGNSWSVLPSCLGKRRRSSEERREGGRGIHHRGPPTTGAQAEDKEAGGRRQIRGICHAVPGSKKGKGSRSRRGGNCAALA